MIPTNGSASVSENKLSDIQHIVFSLTNASSFSLTNASSFFYDQRFVPFEGDYRGLFGRLAVTTNNGEKKCG